MTNSFQKNSFDSISANIDSWKSIDFIVRQDFVSNDPVMSKAMTYHTVEDHYIETSKGQRFLETVSLEGNRVILKSMHYCDGMKYADVNYSQKTPDEQQSAVIKRSFLMEGKSDRVDRPVPLLYYYVGKQPIHKSISIAKLIGPSDVLNRPSDRWLFRDVKWFMTQDQVFDVSRDDGLVLRVTGSTPADQSAKQILWEWTADSVDAVGGHAFVKKSHQIEYNLSPPGLPTKSDSIEPTPQPVLFTRTYLVKSIDFDKEYPDSTFWPKFQPGLNVLDSITGKMYTEPGEKIPIDQAKSSQVVPITATPPTDWTSAGATIALVAGFVLLATAGFFRFRKLA